LNVSWSGIHQRNAAGFPIHC